MAAQLDWLARTKLLPPASRPDVVPRSDLLTRLTAAVAAHRLSLVSAPAGYGKTTLLAAFAAATTPTAWLTLDDGDVDASRLLGGLVAAVGMVAPRAAAGASVALDQWATGAGDPRRVVVALVNGLAEHAPPGLVIVVDDVHFTTDPAAFAALDHLIERLPSSVHLVLSSRHDPPLALARLRGRRELAELRLADLRLSLEQAAAFLNDQLGLDLAADRVEAAHRRTEGWPAGLALLAQSLAAAHGPAERAALVERVLATDRRVFEFLADEVFQREDETTRDFLLETSILPELTAPLCAAVTGQADADVEARLEQLRRRNLLVADAASGTALRYHALFADFLRVGLERARTPEQRQALHRRAAETDDRPQRRLQHYLAAALPELAATEAERAVRAELATGLPAPLIAAVEVLPERARAGRPGLAHALGIVALRRGRVDAAIAHFEAALAGFEAADDPAGACLVLADLAAAAFFGGRFADVARLTGRALAGPLPDGVRVRVLRERARTFIFQDRVDAAAAASDEAFAVALRATDPTVLGRVLEVHGLGAVALPGGVDRLERACREGDARGDDDLAFRTALAEQWAVVHGYRGRLHLAVAAADRAMRMAEEFGGLPLWRHWTARVVRLSCALAIGERPPLEPPVAELFALADANPSIVIGFVYALAHAAWLEGDAETVRHVARRAADLPRSENRFEAMWRPLLAAKLALLDSDRATALRMLRACAEAERATRLFNVLGSAAALLAGVLLDAGRTAEALQEIDAELAACQAQGAPGRILWEGGPAVQALRLARARGTHRELAARLLAEIGDSVEPRPASGAIGEHGQSLTPREIEVLAAIAGGATNRAIANQLVVTERTVKAHVTNIFAKLGVSSRTQAFARGRELGIV